MVEDRCIWQGGDAISHLLRQGYGVVIPDHDREVYAEDIHEIFHLFQIVHGHSNDLYTSGGVLILKLYQDWHLFQARRTPGGPEIDDQYLASPFAAVSDSSVGIF